MMPHRPFPSRIRPLAVTAGVVAFGVGALVPALAEDTGLWEVLHGNARAIRAVAPVPGFYPYVQRATPAPAPRIVRVPPPPVETPPRPATPPDPAKRDNPLAALLHDHTLRYGDIVMFPDGARMFRGESGHRHRLDDFVTLSAARDLPRASRAKLAGLPTGENDAWSADLSSRPARPTSLARRGQDRVQDVETTGSLGKTVTVRAGREVRVIRVPD